MERSSIVKLNYENYDLWKLVVEFLLVREGLWQYASPGVKPAPVTDGANTTELAAWEMKQTKKRVPLLDC